jgi:hypothetical protein
MIGQIFKRRPGAAGTLPKNVRVSGAAGDSWSCTDADSFGPTFAMSPAQLAVAYGAPPEPPAFIDQEAIRAPSADELRAAMFGYRGGEQGSDAPAEGHAPTPEEIFAADGR